MNVRQTVEPLRRPSDQGPPSSIDDLVSVAAVRSRGSYRESLRTREYRAWTRSVCATPWTKVPFSIL